jgi:hypothetical protein
MLRSITLFLSILFLVTGVFTVRSPGNEFYGSLIGEIRDARNVNGVADAKITYKVGLFTNTVETDGNGMFRIADIPLAKNIPLFIAHPGYKDTLYHAPISSAQPAPLTIDLNSQYLRLIYPNGGESIFAGSEVHITWISEGIDTVRLEMSLNGGRDWMTITEEADASKGFYIWDVPDIPSPEYLIRITDTHNSDIRDTSDRGFSNSST